MKPILILIALGIAAIGCAQTPFLAPEWKVTVQVMDETGHSVPDAQASIGYCKMYWQPPATASIQYDPPSEYDYQWSGD
jgi:hypothetical protein